MEDTEYQKLHDEIAGVKEAVNVGLAKENAELHHLAEEEHHIEEELKDFEKEIQELKRELRGGVVEKFTMKDISRGVVGSIFGMSIMAWHESVQHAALNMVAWQLVLVFVLTIAGGVSVLYFSQYKKIKETWIIHQLLPKRFVIFYLLSLFMVSFVYFAFGVITFETPLSEVGKLVLVMGLPTMIGASAADIVK